MKKVSIIIPIYIIDHELFGLTVSLINDLQFNTKGVEIETIVVDDCSPHRRLSQLLRQKYCKNTVWLANDRNLGFAQTVNKGIGAASNDLICLLNNDIRLPNPHWLKIMVESLENNKLDMTAPAGGRTDSRFNYLPGEAKKKGDKFEYLVGWCMLVKRSVFDKIGLIPTNFGTGFWEDNLFCYRAKHAGFKMDITEGLMVEHLYHATFKSSGIDIGEQYNKNRKIFLDIIKKEK